MIVTDRLRYYARSCAWRCRDRPVHLLPPFCRLLLAPPWAPDERSAAILVECSLQPTHAAQSETDLAPPPLLRGVSGQREEKGIEEEEWSNAPYGASQYHRATDIDILTSLAPMARSGGTRLATGGARYVHPNAPGTPPTVTSRSLENEHDERDPYPPRAEGGGTIVCRVVDRTRSSSLHIRARVRFQQPHAASPCLDCRSSGSGSTDGCRLRRPQPSLNSAFRQVRTAYGGVTELQRAQCRDHDT